MAMPTSGDAIYSFSATVDADTASGAKTLPVTITDALARTGTTSIALSVSLAAAVDHADPGAWRGVAVCRSERHARRARHARPTRRTRTSSPRWRRTVSTSRTPPATTTDDLGCGLRVHQQRTDGSRRRRRDGQRPGAGVQRRNGNHRHAESYRSSAPATHCRRRTCSTPIHRPKIRPPASASAQARRSIHRPTATRPATSPASTACSSR